MSQFHQVIRDARAELGDTYEGNYSYAESDMLRYAVEGVREAWKVRSSTRYDTATGKLYDVAVVLTPVAFDDSYEVPLPPEVQFALTYYIVFRCLSRDVTDAGNAKAAAVAKARFDQIIMG